MHIYYNDLLTNIAAICNWLVERNNFLYSTAKIANYSIKWVKQEEYILGVET